MLKYIVIYTTNRKPMRYTENELKLNLKNFNTIFEKMENKLTAWKKLYTRSQSFV